MNQPAWQHNNYGNHKQFEMSVHFAIHAYGKCQVRLIDRLPTSSNVHTLEWLVISVLKTIFIAGVVDFYEHLSSTNTHAEYAKCVSGHLSHSLGTWLISYHRDAQDWFTLHASLSRRGMRGVSEINVASAVERIFSAVLLTD